MWLWITSRTFQLVRGFTQCACRVDHVVHEYAVIAFHITNQVHLRDLVRFHSLLYDHGERNALAG